MSAVYEVIIGPMLELYLPPRHLRGDRESQRRTIDAYEKALARFGRDTLERAWEKVVAEQTYWVWPNPGVIAEACRQLEPKPKPAHEEEQRKAKAMRMAEEYTGRYMLTSHLAKLAKREGWSGPLREYVTAAAWVQAHLLCQVRHVGWDPHLADKLGHFRQSQEAFEAYRLTIAKSIERGQLRVTIPRDRIQEWKARRTVQETQEPTGERSVG